MVRIDDTVNLNILIKDIIPNNLCRRSIFILSDNECILYESFFNLFLGLD